MAQDIGVILVVLGVLPQFGGTLVQISDLHAYVLGGAHPLDPGYSREVRALAERSGLGARLNLPGQRPMDEIPGWLACADIVVHPTTGPEPFGMSVVEAMAMSKPVVASAHGGPCEIIRDGVDGMLCVPGNAGVFAAVIQSLLNDPSRARALGQAAQQRALEFAPASLVARLSVLMHAEDLPDGA